jgi:formylglycine-generating enzyme required for sulfatase activity
VLRGGAFFSYRDFVRCASRFGSNSDFRYDYFGVRVVVASVHTRSE